MGKVRTLLTSHLAINLANEVFGFNGWSSHIVNMTTDYVDDLKDGRYQVGVTCIVRVTLADGAYHEDVGFGNTENQKFKSMAIENVSTSMSSAVLTCPRPRRRP